MEQKREINKKLSWVFTVISIGELAGALAIVAYGLLKGHMTGTTCNVIMGAALVLYWLLEDIAEPFAVHRFDGITQAQKEAYVKYILLDLVGFAGIACFLFGVGGSSSGSNSGILGAVVYVVMAALLSVIISVTLCAGFHYICHLQKLLKELSEK